MEGLIFEILRYARRQVNKVKFWKMAIIGGNFNINFGQTLALGSSLCNSLRTKLHAWTESSIMVEFMVKFIWQHNLLVGSYHTFKMPPGRLDFWCSKGKKWDPSCNSQTKTQRSEPKWLLKYLIIPNFCAKFQPNRLTTTFGPWNTVSDKDTSDFFGPLFCLFSPFCF